MKLNKQQQASWNTVTSIFSALSRVSPNAEALEQEMKTWVSGFETLVEHEAKVKIRMLPAPSIEMVDCSKDFLKLNRDAEGSIGMRARVEGISISSTVSYKENYAHSNGAVIDALRALADSLEMMTVEMRDQTDSIDIYALIGVSHSSNDNDDGDDAPLVTLTGVTLTGFIDEHDDGGKDAVLIQLCSTDTQE